MDITIQETSPEPWGHFRQKCTLKCCFFLDLQSLEHFPMEELNQSQRGQKLKGFLELSQCRGKATA